MSVLFGLYQPEEGVIKKNGQVVQINNPNDATALDIGMVHQEFMLLPGFTITENIKLNREISKTSMLSKLLGKNLETLDMEDTLAYRQTLEAAARMTDTAVTEAEDDDRVVGYKVLRINGTRRQMTQLLEQLEKEDA